MNIRAPLRHPEADSPGAPGLARVGSPWPWAALAQAALVGFGCTSGVELEPARSANEAGMASTTVEGVDVSAKGDDWTGDSEVTEHVTPVYLAIENDGEQPVRIRYSNITLVSGDGEHFQALPPFDVHGTVTKTVERLVPRFGHRGAALAPYFGHVYQGVEVEPPLAYMDYEYYDFLYDNWKAEIPLPTQFMQEVALPEALVRPRGQLSGFVYFKRVPSSKEQVTLQVDLVDADSGSAIGTARIPFAITD